MFNRLIDVGIPLKSLRRYPMTLRLPVLTLVVGLFFVPALSAHHSWPVSRVDALAGLPSTRTSPARIHRAIWLRASEATSSRSS